VLLASKRLKGVFDFLGLDIERTSDITFGVAGLVNFLRIITLSNMDYFLDELKEIEFWFDLVVL